MELPSIRQLECFVAVFDRLNFRQAAESCSISQPALSAQIKQLEAQLGLTLFERDKKQVLPSRAGRALIERARNLLTELAEFTEVGRSMAEPLSGTLRLGVIPTISPYILPRALSAVRREYPALKLILREDRTAQLVQCLDAGELDVLLVALEADLGTAESLPIIDDPFYLALPNHHQLGSKAEVCLADIEAEEVLLLDDGHCFRDQALEVCERAQANEADDFRASSLTTLVQMVAGNVGVTLLPKIALAVECCAERNLLTLPFATPSPKRTIGLAFRSSSHRKEEFAQLAQFLGQQLI